ncbi:MAG: prephenate dehydrogenase [Euryarchaeota archaeon]|nr:prephenate dehydrogenase [Euryarchaeota archaeon]
MKITIIGGTGQMGSWFAHFFKTKGFDVTISGPNTKTGDELAKKLNIKYTLDNKAAAKDADIVLVSVPIEKTVDVIAEVAPQMKTGALLTDTTSVKVDPVKAMQKFAAPGVEIIGMHPMFAPRFPSLKGQVIILTPVNHPPWLEKIKDFFEKENARVFIATPEMHDEMMAIIQGLTHFVYIATASTLKRLGIDIKESRKLMSPIYELTLDIIARIAGQNPRLYAGIQMYNPKVNEIHKAFIEECLGLQRVIESKDVQAFVKIMSSAAKHMGDVEEAMRKSDKAVRALNRELEELTKRIGKEVALRHIYSESIHVGIVEKVEPEKVILKTQSGRLAEFKISNIELLSDEALLELKKEKFTKITRDFSVVLPKQTDPKVIQQIVANSNDKIISAKILDIYEGAQIPSDKKSVTIRVEALSNADPKMLENAIINLLKGIGGQIR